MFKKGKEQTLCELCVQDSDIMEQGFDGLSLTMS